MNTVRLIRSGREGNMRCIKDDNNNSLSLTEFLKRDYKIILVQYGSYSGLLHRILPSAEEGMDTVHIISIENKYHFMQDEKSKTTFLHFDSAIKHLLGEGFAVYGFDEITELANFLREGR